MDVRQAYVGQRVHHYCQKADCPLYGTVVAILPHSTEPAVMVKWDPYRGIESSITHMTPALPIKPDALEPA